jgi:hypothetical protein
MSDTPRKNDSPRKLDCRGFQAQLPELIAAGENLADNEHLRTCELCRALLADLETIAEAARSLIPIEEPSDKLWDQIESAIKRESGDAEEGAKTPLTPQPE